jgi:hypothetical protein
MAKPSERLLKEITSQIDECIVRVAVAIQIEGLDPKAPVDMATSIRSAASLRDQAKAVDDVYLRWLAEGILELSDLVRGIDPKLIEVHTKAGTPTAELFEDKVAEAKKVIDQQYGLLDSVREIFKDNRTDKKHRIEVLYLVQEVQARVLLIRQRLNMLIHPVLAVLTSRRTVLSLAVLFLIFFPTLYVVRIWQEAGNVDQAVVEEKLKSDVGGLHKAASAPDASLLDKVAAVTKKLSEITSTIPNLLLLSALVLGMFRTLFLRGSWQHPQLRGYEEQLRELARSLRADLKGG